MSEDHLDEQDLDELLDLIARAKGELMATSVIYSEARPSQRLVALTRLEGKLIRRKVSA